MSSCGKSRVGGELVRRAFAAAAASRSVVMLRRTDAGDTCGDCGAVVLETSSGVGWTEVGPCGHWWHTANATAEDGPLVVDERTPALVVAESVDRVLLLREVTRQAPGHSGVVVASVLPQCPGWLRVSVWWGEGGTSQRRVYVEASRVTR